MVKNNGEHLSSSRRGNMPFAMVAVTILLVASAYCAVSGSVRDTEETIGNVSKELELLDSTAGSAKSFIDAELGRIVYDVCTEPTLGNLSERGRTIEERVNSWIQFQFPLYYAGVTIYLLEHSITIQNEKMQLGSDVLAENGYVPSYLKVTGSVKAEFENEYGKTVKTLGISTDGSCALPLTLETGSLFENAVSGEGSFLSQMMVYQLTSLAQYRVINGYGAFSKYGDMGTDSIITEEDVRKAYLNSINALECMYFRDSDGNEYFGTTDLAKVLISENGNISVNLNAIYAQALYGKMDDMVGKWFDYFLGDVLLNILDGIDDALRNAWDSLLSFFKGTNEFSAEPYIREVVGNLDTSLYTGQVFTFTLSSPEGGDDITYIIPYPTVNLYGSDAVKNFKNNYRNDTNSIREWIVTVINAAIIQVANSKGLGTVSADISDAGTFSEILTEAVCSALIGGVKTFEEVVSEMMLSNEVPDQFYAAIYDQIYKNKESIFTYGEQQFSEYIKAFIMPKDTHSELNDNFQYSLGLESNQAVIRDYMQKTDELMQSLELLKTRKGELSVIQKGCIPLLKTGFLVMDLTQDIRSFAVAMCEEFSTNIGINPLSGYTEIVDSREFILQGDGTYTEYLSVSQRSAPRITVGDANGKSTHEVGFNESKDASFCTVFPVSLKDSFYFEVDSSGSLLKSLGLIDSSYGRTLDISIEIEISVVSGWGLSGVTYGSTTNVLQDLYSILLSALEPLLEPLRKLMEMAQDLMNKISEALTMLTQYAAEFLEKLYEAIMAPYERLNSMFTEKLTEVFCEQIIRISEQAEAIVDVSAVGQTVGFTYMGYTVKFTFNMATLEKYTKHIVKAEFSGSLNGIDFTSFINVKTKGDTTKTPYITAGFTVGGSDWDLKANIDPTMTTNKNLVNLSGTVKGIRIDAVLPQAVQYNEIGISLQDIPGIKEVLSNIPSPIAGTKIELDAGISLKYNLPLVTGVIINEFESNPSGTDKDNEWVEILNLSGNSVDLNNWTLTTSKNKVHVIKDVKLSPGERTVIELEGTFLLNSKEYIILKDPDGVEVDRSATMSDSANDGRTCQRGMDGSTEWSLIEGTPGTSNKGGIFGENGIANSVIKDIVKKAAVKAMNEMKHVYTVEALEELFTRTIQYAIDDGINRIASSVVEGSIYVSVDFTDLTSTGRSGFRIYVMVDSDLVGDVLKYLLGKAEALFLNIDDPYNINIDTVIYDDVYVGVSVYGGIKAPSFLGKQNSNEKVLLGIDICCNLSALGSLLGEELGTPKVKAQIGIRNCPYEMIPKQLGVKKNMTYDLWFIRMTFSPA